MGLTEYLSDENLDKAQMGLAASGMVPGPTGIASDVADAGISLGRGDLLGALLAGGAAIPGIGMAFGARGGRHLGKLGKSGRSAAEVHDMTKARRARGSQREARETEARLLAEQEPWYGSMEDAQHSMTESMYDNKSLALPSSFSWDELEREAASLDLRMSDVIERGKDELQRNFNTTMDMMESGALRETHGAEIHLERLDIIMKDRKAVAEFELHRLNGTGFDESVESVVTEIQAEELMRFGADPSQLAGRADDEADLMRNMTELEGPPEEDFPFPYDGPDTQFRKGQISELERLGGEEDFPYPFREPPMPEGEGFPDPLSGLFKDIDLDPTE